MNNMPYEGNNGRMYRYGEFFPIELSPFAYNETLAQEYFALTKEQTMEKGYKWRDEEVKDFGITLYPSSVSGKILPDNIKDVDDNVLKEVIGCIHKGDCIHKCITAFRITPQELQFYRTMNIPLPHLCSNCRHYERLSNRNPLQTWPGKCMCNGHESYNIQHETQYQSVNSNHQSHTTDEPCQNTFQTPYQSGTPNIVYCESCYQQEII